ncbi:MAG: G-D-S-L family lipolytic protein [Bacteroidales bacterium]|nr:G-D-S-L family lipolytic protein [Bacteroidales bacterium]
MRGSFLFLVLFISLQAALTAQTVVSPYAADILQFRQSDSLIPPPANPILFIGSSSFTMWKDVNDYFPDKPIINRAYGGSCLTDLIRDYPITVLPYKPKQIVIYCGENDFAREDTLLPEDILERFSRLFSILRINLPETKITFVSMKPSPSRWHLREKYLEGNRLIRKYIRKQDNADYIDVWSKMLNDKKEPKPEIFLEDQLHMNPQGYLIWKKAIYRHLIK